MPSFSVNSALAAIRARRDESETLEQQEATALGRGRLDPSSPKERIARAAGMETHIREQIEWLQDQPESPLRTQRLHAAYDRLGELAAEQGDFERAATISRTTERRHHYEAISDAIADPKKCTCPTELIVDRKDHSELRVSPVIHYDTLVTPTGGTIQLQKCTNCGLLTTDAN